MSSDASQSILRMTLLACATAAFMVVWSGDASRTVGMSLAERNRQVAPAHAIANPQAVTQLAARPRARVERSSEARPVTTMKPALDARADVNSLPAGTYRVVFDDGRVEWLTVIDRAGGADLMEPSVMVTMVNGEAAHVIRVTSRPAGGSAIR
ncbi:hypothetical protein Pan44_18440 [Caulifigura coniformis]|uniref:Uncharacterized protein n=1 Tax=Caulifigura coniformis TaxID=2527983 RepID=A0A517SCG4_9PLAN|nr:hypothetical protein [Caulifigura coniformis]QDT53820.1 hypothetical protein Pan44_18440 [Caulifigura coniformis]